MARPIIGFRLSPSHQEKLNAMAKSSGNSASIQAKKIVTEQLKGITK